MTSSNTNHDKEIVSSVAGKQDPKLIKCYNEKAGGKFQQVKSSRDARGSLLFFGAGQETNLLGRERSFGGRVSSRGGKRDSEEQCILKLGAGQGKTVGKWVFQKTIFSHSISLTTVVLNIDMKQIQGYYSYYTS